MTTGTVQSASVTLSKHKESNQLNLALTNAQGAEVFHGQEVKISGDLGVALRAVGTEIPIGVVSVGGLDTVEVTIATNFERTLKVIATGGTLTAGQEVKPNGTRTLTVPQYVAAITADKVSAVVLKGATIGLEALVGILRAPYVKPA